LNHEDNYNAFSKEGTREMKNKEMTASTTPLRG
jgi:hypothetical protein